MFDDFKLLTTALISKIIWIFFPKRRDLEVIRLRKEIQILMRQAKRPKFTKWDRLFFVSLFKANADSMSRSLTIKPSTVIAWHRKLVAKKWDFSEMKVGRPPISEKVKQLILEMKAANRLSYAKSHPSVNIGQFSAAIDRRMSKI